MYFCKIPNQLLIAKSDGWITFKKLDYWRRRLWGGAYWVDGLIKSGETAICLDDFFTGSRDYVENWIGLPSFEFIQHDIPDPIKLNVDRVWHLACQAF